MDAWRCLEFSRLRMIDFITGKRPPTINLLLSSLIEITLTGESERALVLCLDACAKADARLRLITLDGPFEAGLPGTIASSAGRKPPDEPEFYDGSVRHTQDTYRRLVVSPNDLFVATDWASSRVARFLSLRPRFVWLIQSVEPAWLPRGDEQLLAEESFTGFTDFFPIFGSPELRREMVASGWFPEDGEEVFAGGSVAAPGGGSEDSSRRKTLFIDTLGGDYAIRSLECVDEAIRLGVLSGSEWKVVMKLPRKGRPPFFCDGSPVEALPEMGFPQLRRFLRSVDLSLCLGRGNVPCPTVEEVLAGGGRVVSTAVPDTGTVVEAINEAVATGKGNPSVETSGFSTAAERIAEMLAK